MDENTEHDPWPRRFSQHVDRHDPVKVTSVGTAT